MPRGRSRQTHCQRGHPFAGENLVTRSDGWRACLTCRRRWPEPDGTLPAAGRMPAEDDGSRVQCHLCGRWWVKLGNHVRRGHGMDPAEYREQFGLNRTTGLIAPELAHRVPVQHLARARLIGFEHVSVEAQDRSRRRARRTEAKLQQSAHSRARLASAARRAAEAARLTAPAVIERTQRRLAELRTDPDWAHGWRQRVSEGRRALTPEQVQGIRAQRGKSTAAELAGRYGVSRSTVWRIWRGELLPD